MRLMSWLHSVAAKRQRNGRGRARAVERLESRVLPAIFFVNSGGGEHDFDLQDDIADIGKIEEDADGNRVVVPAGITTLQAALDQANFNANLDIIRFGLGFLDPLYRPDRDAWVYDASAGSMPNMTFHTPIVLDALAMLGSNGEPRIQFDGGASFISGGVGILIKPDADESELHGISVVRFAQAISAQADDFVLTASYIGVNPDGSDGSPTNVTNGVAVIGNNAVIGGLSSGDRNVISSQSTALSLVGNQAVVQNNHFGTDPSGATLIRNTTGINVASGNGHVLRGNVITGGTIGISLTESSQGVTVAGNRIGTTANGLTRLGVDQPLKVSGSGHVVQDNTLVTSDNTQDRIGAITIAGGSGHRVLSNRIGVNVTGNVAFIPLIRRDGIVIENGHTLEIRGNVIGGTSTGLRVPTNPRIAQTESIRNVIVQGNHIGVGLNGTSAIGNSTAIDVSGDLDDWLIGGTAASTGNLVANNGDDVLIRANLAGVTPQNIAVLGNAITTGSTTDPGIDLGLLGVTANDTNDSDSGPNGLQNFPVLSSVSLGEGTTLVTGTLNSTPSTSFRIEFFETSTARRHGPSLLGAVNVTTNSSGNAAIEAVLPRQIAGLSFVTATATSVTGSGFGDTSEFSAPVQPLALIVNTGRDASDFNPNDGTIDVDPARAGAQVSLRAAIEFANATAGTDIITFNIPNVAGTPMIFAVSELPAITESVIIDASTQPSVRRVILDGSQASGTEPNGLSVIGCEVRLVNVEVTQFGGTGIRLSNLGELHATNLSVTQNREAGIVATNGFIELLGDAIVSDNGHGNSLEPGDGISLGNASLDAANVRFFNVQNNAGAGIRNSIGTDDSSGVITLNTARIDENGDHGLFVNASLVISGSSEISRNGGLGLVNFHSSGLRTETLTVADNAEGGLILEGSLLIGIEELGDSSSRFSVLRNGLAKPDETGDGVVLNRGSILMGDGGFFEVAENNGDGVRVVNGQVGLTNAAIHANRGHGLLASDQVILEGVSEISDNNGDGVSAGTDIITSTLTVQNNRGWGLRANGVRLSEVEDTEFVRVRFNGTADGTHGGILIETGALQLEEAGAVEIGFNFGDGIQSRSSDSVMQIANATISLNHGTGVASAGNVTVSDSEVCLNGLGDFAVTGELTLNNVRLTADCDPDGLADEQEDGAPNGGDGNNDGVPDRDQDNVSSLPAIDDSGYVSIATRNQRPLLNVHAFAPLDPPPPSIELPLGLFAFEIGLVPLGGSAIVDLFLPPGITVNSYLKFGPTADNSTHHRPSVSQR